jgi:molybdopterin molybdotransferase
MIEQTQLVSDGSRVRIDAGEVVKGQHIMRRGESITRGAMVLQAGRRLRCIDVGLLCEVGRTRVQVIRPPQVAVLATGNELVPAGQIPDRAQIRNSNGPLLCAMSTALHCQVVDLGIGRDQVDTLRERIELGLQSDVLVLSGGVSAGVLDLVPAVFEQVGIDRVFHKVYLKPGKPLWFGTRDSGGHRTLVFGLPGNPVGSLVCFELFVRPALGQISGARDVTRQQVFARLRDEHRQRGDRPTYTPAVASRAADGQLLVAPLTWRGSADQRALATANCLAIFPPGERIFPTGELVEIYFLESCGWH